MFRVVRDSYCKSDVTYAIFYRGISLRDLIERQNRKSGMARRAIFLKGGNNRLTANIVHSIVNAESHGPT